MIIRMRIRRLRRIVVVREEPSQDVAVSAGKRWQASIDGRIGDSRTL